jgi:hypothetical protein
MLVFIKKGLSLPGIPTAKTESSIAGALLTNTANTTTTGVRVYPNPVVDKEMQLTFSNIAEGNYKIRLINSKGQTVYEASLYVAGNYFKELIQLGKTHTGCYQLVITANDGSKTIQSIIIQ